ncbi:hypothetical protein [Mesorhizobium sp. WSM4976]
MLLLGPPGASRPSAIAKCVLPTILAGYTAQFTTATTGALTPDRPIKQN